MSKRSVLLAGALLLLSAMASSAQPANVTPRDADEAQAWRLFNAYQESKRIAAPLDKEIRNLWKDATDIAYGAGAFRGIDWDAKAAAMAKAKQLQAEEKRQADLLAAWDAKFFWRYGDLRWASDTKYDPITKRTMSRIEFALIYFPFTYVPGKAGATTPPPTTRLVGGTYTAEMGAADKWSHVTVTVGNVANFTTENRPGWRYNGTGFTAVAAGSGPVSIKIDVKALGDVSYYDYMVGVSVKASDGAVLLADKPVISKDGGSKSYSVTWTPGGSATDITVDASILGGNPESFTNYVSGTIGVSAGSGQQATGTATPKPPTATAAPATTAATTTMPAPTPAPTSTVAERTLFSSGNDGGVANGGTPPSFTFATPATITYVMTYHWNSGRGAPGGTIALKRDDGTVFGPWAVTVVNGVYWEVRPNVTLPAGRYSVIDSDPATWAQNAQSGGAGMTTIKGQ